jgi:hypothetical protein
MPKYRLTGSALKKDGQIIPRGGEVTLTEAEAKRLPAGTVEIIPPPMYINTASKEVRTLKPGEKLAELPEPTLKLLEYQSLVKAIVLEFGIPKSEVQGKKKADLVNLVIEKRGYADMRK